jgi:hypothetical protein
MPPNPVLMHALRLAPPDRLRRVLRALADALSESPDWTEIERLVRERVGVAEALQILDPGAPTPSADDAAAPAPEQGRPIPRRRSRR